MEHCHPLERGDVLAVRMANDIQPNSRWYTGLGIYRRWNWM